MKSYMRFFAAFSLIVFGIIYFVAAFNSPANNAQVFESPNNQTFQKREEAYRANNLGVALLEQFNHKEAEENFRRALSLDPNLKIAQINLAIALFNIPEYDAALREATKSAGIAPESPQPFYILGLIARAQNRTEDAVAAFQKVLTFDPQDVGANVNLGQIYVQQRKYTEAVTAFRTAVEAEPYNSTALYNLATALLREGKREEGQQLMTRFQALRQSGAATNVGLNYLEQGRYGEGIVSTGAETELVDKTEPKVVFQNANIGLPVSKSKRAVKLFDKAAAMLDFDGDGDFDIAQTAPAKLFRNDKGKFVDASLFSGDFGKAGNLFCYSIIAGDYDNDSLVDLFASCDGKLALYRNTGKGKFSDVTNKAKIPNLEAVASASAFVDVDHDGDLDIVLGAPEKLSNYLFRNNGDGSFTDISESAFGINQMSGALSIVPTDFDNRRDVDLLFLNPGKPPVLLRNLRNGAFQNVASEVGLEIKSDLFCAAVGDFNKDSFVDFFFGRASQPGVFAVSDGRGKFVIKDAPQGTTGAASALFLDYDNDGLLDLLVNTTKGLILSRNLGDSWSQATAQPFKTNLDLSASKQILSADIDSDGDLDLLIYAKNGTLQFLRNLGGEANKSKLVRLTGRVSNKTGIGAKIDLRAGSLVQKLESYSTSPAVAPADIHFGLGKREKADAVRVIWTSGIIQAEINFPDSSKNQVAAERLKIEELDRKPSSCPYLYAWNGEKFEFITDFLGGGEMAYALGNGQTNTPDPDEYVRITSDLLKPKNGKYELRVTNELEEVLYLDRFELLAVDHPEKTEIYPNEGLGAATAGKFILYTTKNEKPPLSATDGKGRSVLENVRAMDRNFYDGFESEKIRGYAKPHELILTLDDKRGFGGKTLLLLTGWTDYAFSSDNVAAAQAGLALQPPKLQVKNRRGEWQTVIENTGISVGRPQTVVVDLTGKFLSESREVRILTNMKTLWDKIAVDTSEDISRNLQISKLEPAAADLRERGFSLEIKPDGKEPVLVDYEKVLKDGRWKYFSGNFTRLGDVLPLLRQPDDIFVISKTGDELALSFNESDLPPLGKGMKRTFLLYAAGYSKEMDINSASPDAVLPLPFRAMTKYPYGENEGFPMTEEKRKIYDEYTTRSVKTVFPRIEAALLK